MISNKRPSILGGHNNFSVTVLPVDFVNYRVGQDLDVLFGQIVFPGIDQGLVAI